MQKISKLLQAVPQKNSGQTEKQKKRHTDGRYFRGPSHRGSNKESCIKTD